MIEKSSLENDFKACKTQEKHFYGKSYLLYT